MPQSNTDKLNLVLESIQAIVRDGDRLPIVVFDLDSTLFSTAPRNLRILQEFVADHGQRWPSLIAAASKVTLDDLGWNLGDSLVQRGLPSDHEALSQVRAYWQLHFFTDAYTALDMPTPGAAHFVRLCHQHGALVYYLTGRHVSSSDIRLLAPGADTDGPQTFRMRSNSGMEMGTVQSLTQRGFPFWQGRCELHLKPNFHTSDEEYKATAIAAIESLRGQVVATFDNEPANVQIFSRAFPAGSGTLNFLLDTVCSPRGIQLRPSLEADPDIHIIPSFQL